MSYMYEADPNDNTRQQPRALSSKAFSNAITPSDGVLTTNPSYILINQSGSYGFIYEHTGSLGTTISNGNSEYTTGSVILSAAGGLPVRLDINPTAWHRNDAAGAVGDVTFVYRGQ